jgi:hypothetical protein
MHDLSALESNEPTEVMEWEGEAEEPELDESDELEAAAQLLGVGNEAELDNFLGDLIRKAAGALDSRVRSATGSGLAGLLKRLARQALPMVATAIGGPVGGYIAKGGLDTAAKAFGLELEGLSDEDQELELARRYVRIANAAAHRVVRHGPTSHPRAALRWAIRRHAPGLFRYPRHRRPFYAGYRSGYPVAVGYPVPVDYPVPAFDQSANLDRRGTDAPVCPPCPVCPTCGAPPVEATPPSEPAAEPAGSHEYESTYEDEDEDPVAYSGEQEAGRWIRRGNRIILYGA